MLGKSLVSDTLVTSFTSPFSHMRSYAAAGEFYFSTANSVHRQLFGSVCSTPPRGWGGGSCDLSPLYVPRKNLGTIL